MRSYNKENVDAKRINEVTLYWFKNASYSEHIGKNPNEVTRKAKGCDGGEIKIVLKEVNKGVWGMPRLSEAKKDVISCDKLRGSANSY